MSININSDFKTIEDANSKNSFSSYQIDKEAKNYNGCSYKYQNLYYTQRTAKITPKKNGQFVTSWKRDKAGLSTPYHINDPLDFFIVICHGKNKTGMFLFTKSILVKEGILSKTSINPCGKRGFRVYPPWDLPKSAQALKTQNWQKRYFQQHFSL